jgi:Double zinc ribbon
MDALDRTFKHLLQTIQARYPAYLTQPFEVSELYQNILPYRHHRRELGLETNQDYELVLLQLLSGARDYLVVNDEMRQRLARELASPNPDPGAFREFSTVQIAISPAAARRFQSGAVGDAEVALAGASTGSVANSDTTPRPPSRASAAATTTAARSSSMAPTAPSLAAQPAPRRPSSAPAPTASAATPTPTPRATTAAAPIARPTQTMVPQAGEQCRYCNGALPTGRRITFCPHCGQNLTVVNCLACGTELELGWKFCTTCGRPVTAT